MRYSSGIKHLSVWIKKKKYVTVSKIHVFVRIV